MPVLLGVDVGKTNVRVGVFDLEMRLLDRWSVSAVDVDIALGSLDQHLRALCERFEIQAAGISIFGPLQTDSRKPDFGAVIEASDAAWSDVNVPLHVASTLGLPVYFDFDVNAGALAESALGTARGIDHFVYFSVGTGIGGALHRSSLVPGFAPQLGHMYVPREKDDLDFEGSCRFHGDCLQGLASGRALAQRWGVPAEQLEPDHPAWDLEARYLARACANLVYAFSPERIVIGSSVGSTSHLIPEINRYLMRLLNNFLDPGLRTLYSDRPVVAGAALGPGSSLTGAAILAGRHLGLRLDSAFSG